MASLHCIGLRPKASLITHVQLPPHSLSALLICNILGPKSTAKSPAHVLCLVLRVVSKALIIGYRTIDHAL